MKNMDINNN